jgi:hypothetical protein
MTFFNQRERLEALERVVALLRDARVPATLPVASPAAAVALAPVVNYLRNSDIAYTRDAYDNSPPVGGDAALEAAHVFSHANSAAILAETTAQILKAPGHSLYSSDDPDFDKTNGVVRLGTTRSLDFPLSRKFIEPSALCFCGFIARLKDDTVSVPAGTRARLGVWDNTDDGTGAARGFLKGDPFAITATPHPAGASAYEYKIIALTDWGMTYESNTLAVANGPAVLNASNFIGLFWPPIIGVTRYDIYRKVGGVFYLVYEIRNGQTSYFDKGTAEKTVTGYPSTTATEPRAFVEIPFEPTTAWQPFVGAFAVPQTYNKALTTGKQWFRAWLTQAPSDALGLEFDKFWLANKDGAWSASAEDLNAKNDFSNTPAGSTQGGAGVSGGDGVNPGDGGRRDTLGEQPNLG